MTSSDPSSKDKLVRSTKKSRPKLTPKSIKRKVTLKLKIDKQDHIDGNSQSPTTLESSATKTTTAQSGRKSTKPRRTRRGRPRNASLIAAAAAAEHGSCQDQAKSEDTHDLDHPTITDFRPVSLLSFPSYLPTIKPAASDPASTETQTQSQPLRLNIPKRCAGCGVTAPAASSNGVHKCTAIRGTISPPHTPLWHRLNPRMKRFVDTETGSIVEQGIIRSGPVPNTPGFWYDLTLGEMAKDSEDVDLKMLCLNLVRWRSANDVADLEGVCVQAGADGKEDGSISGAWGMLLEDVVRKGKMWRKTRRQREKECENVAGWAVWEHGHRRERQGEFVEDETGAWVLHAPGEDGEVRKVLNLGYRRQRKLGPDEACE